MKFEFSILSLFALGLLVPLHCFAASDPFQVRAKVKDSKTVSFEVKNISETEQKFAYMSCSYSDNWVVNVTYLHIEGQECNKNFPSQKTLKPGEAFSGELTMHMTSEIGEAKSIAFKVGFAPFELPMPITVQWNKTGPFWSNEIVELQGSGTSPFRGTP